MELERMAADRTVGPIMLLAAAVAGFVAASYTEPAPASPQSGHPGPAQSHPELPVYGHGATTPTEIPKRGWWLAIKQAANGFNEDRLMTEAAGVTFYTLLALFPAIASLISLYGLFADPATLADQLQWADGVIPGGGIDIIKQQVTSLTSNGHQALGFGVIIGLLVSLWSANSGIKSLFDALNIVYHERETRSYVWRTVISFCFTMGALVFLIVALISVVVVPIVFNYIGLGSALPAILAVLRWPVLLVVLTLFLGLVYRFGPSRNDVPWQWVTWGGAFASITWVIVSLGFSYYVSNFGSYNKTYGSLGAAIGFMTWMWISSMVVLLGGELNAELERQAGRRPH
jgi:membrane protein